MFIACIEPWGIRYFSLLYLTSSLRLRCRLSPRLGKPPARGRENWFSVIVVGTDRHSPLIARGIASPPCSRARIGLIMPYAEWSKPAFLSVVALLKQCVASRVCMRDGKGLAANSRLKVNYWEQHAHKKAAGLATDDFGYIGLEALSVTNAQRLLVLTTHLKSDTSHAEQHEHPSSGLWNSPNAGLIQRGA